MSKGSIIIVEGPQGVGKSTFANYLRENLPSSNLYRLSGIPDKTKTGKEKNRLMYLNLINYMESLEESGMHLIFDRTFFTEQVYCSLGYKDYDFSDVYNRLVKKLCTLDTDIYFIVLYLKDTEIYRKRLERVHHNYQAFSIDSSINQQNEYLKLADALKKTNIHVLKVAMDDFDKGYKKIINSIPVLKENIKEKK